MAKAKTEVIPLHDQEIQTGELAAIVGKSSRWIRQLASEGTLRPVSRGKFILGETIQSYIAYVTGGREGVDQLNLIDHKTEHERLKVEKAAIELAQIRGELHASEDIEAVMNDMLMAFRQKILTIPTKMSPQLIGIEEINVIKGKLTEAMYEALSELSEYKPELFSEGVVEKDDLDEREEDST